MHAVALADSPTKVLMWCFHEDAALMKPEIITYAVLEGARSFESNSKWRWNAFRSPNSTSKFGVATSSFLAMVARRPPVVDLRSFLTPDWAERPHVPVGSVDRVLEKSADTVGSPLRSVSHCLRHHHHCLPNTVWSWWQLWPPLIRPVRHRFS